MIFLDFLWHLLKKYLHRIFIKSAGSIWYHVNELPCYDIVKQMSSNNRIKDLHEYSYMLIRRLLAFIASCRIIHQKCWTSVQSFPIKIFYNSSAVKMIFIFLFIDEFHWLRHLAVTWVWLLRSGHKMSLTIFQ